MNLASSVDSLLLTALGKPPPTPWKSSLGDPYAGALTSDNLRQPRGNGGIPNQARKPVVEVPRRPPPPSSSFVSNVGYRAGGMNKISRPTSRKSETGITSRPIADESLTRSPGPPRVRRKTMDSRTQNSDPSNVIVIEDLSADESAPPHSTAFPDTRGARTSRFFESGRRSAPMPSNFVRDEDPDDPIEQSLDAAPALDLKAIRKGAMKGKSKAEDSRLTTDKATPYLYVPFANCTWGAKEYIGGRNGEPDCVRVRTNGAPAVTILSAQDVDQENGSPPFAIPFASIEVVKATDPLQPKHYLFITLKVGGTFNCRHDAPARDVMFFDPECEDPSLRTIIFELNNKHPKWRSKQELKLAPSPEVFGKMIQRMKSANVPIENIQLSAAKVLAADHGLRIAALIRQQTDARRNANKTENTRPAKRQRSPSPGPSRRPLKSRTVQKSDDEWDVIDAPKPPPPRPKTYAASAPRRDLKRRASRRAIIDDSEEEVMESPKPSTPPEPVIKNPHELILVYPPTGVGAVNITRGDFSRLRPGEFLNDTLIEFGLKWIMNDLRTSKPELAESVHMFNSFFYMKLSSKNEGYKSVQRWTNKIDLFSKKFIIIPINEDFHWYLAIIYNPQHAIPKGELPAEIPQEKRASVRIATSPTQSVNKRVAPPPTSRQSEFIAIDVSPTLAGDESTSAPPPERSPSPSDSSSVKAMTRSASQVHLDPSDDTMDRDGEGDVTIIDGSDEDAKGPTRARRGRSGSPMDLDPEPDGTKVGAGDLRSTTGSELREGTGRLSSASVGESAPPLDVPIDLEESPQPTADLKTHIFMLDSLGANRGPTRGKLAEYLLQEADDKKRIPPGAKDDPRYQKYVKDRIAGHNAKVPAQPNHCDCGVYLLHFVETFLNNTEECTTRMIKPGKLNLDEKNRLWHKKELDQKREVLSARITENSEQWRALQANAGPPRASSEESDSFEPIFEDPQRATSMEAAVASSEDADRKEERSVLMSTAPSSDAGEVEAMVAPHEDDIGEQDAYTTETMATSPGTLPLFSFASFLGQPNEPEPSAIVVTDSTAVSEPPLSSHGNPAHLPSQSGNDEAAERYSYSLLSTRAVDMASSSSSSTLPQSEPRSNHRAPRSKQRSIPQEDSDAESEESVREFRAELLHEFRQEHPHTPGSPELFTSTIPPHDLTLSPKNRSNLSLPEIRVPATPTPPSLPLPLKGKEKHVFHVEDSDDEDKLPPAPPSVASGSKPLKQSELPYGPRSARKSVSVDIPRPGSRPASPSKRPKPIPRRDPNKYPDLIDLSSDPDPKPESTAPELTMGNYQVHGGGKVTSTQNGPEGESRGRASRLR